jgi:hypothetical protein
MVAFTGPPRGLGFQENTGSAALKKQSFGYYRSRDTSPANFLRTLSISSFPFLSPFLLRCFRDKLKPKRLRSFLQICDDPFSLSLFVRSRALLVFGFWQLPTRQSLLYRTLLNGIGYDDCSSRRLQCSALRLPGPNSGAGLKLLHQCRGDGLHYRFCRAYLATQAFRYQIVSFIYVQALPEEELRCDFC